LIDTECAGTVVATTRDYHFDQQRKITMNSIYKLVIALLARVVLSALVMWPAMAGAADNPDWAYPITPPPKPLEQPRHAQMPGKHKQYTQAQIDDPFNPPDWYPDEHPPMPEIVARGGPKPDGRACAQCHLTSGDGHPESSSLAGLPAAYIIWQMQAFKDGDRKASGQAS